MSHERDLLVEENFFYENEFDIQQVFQHLLKFVEILDASLEKLPLLQRIELELRTYCWDDVLLTRVKASRMNRALLVKWSDVKIGYDHAFIKH